MTALLGLTILSFFISIILFVPFIDFLYRAKLRRQKQETRDMFNNRTPIFDKFHKVKVGTPVGGGILIIVVTVILTFWAYGILSIPTKAWEIFVIFFSVISFGLLGLFDDWKKLADPTKKDAFFGLRFRHKFVIQWILAFIIASVFYFQLGYSFIFIHGFGLVSIGALFIPFAAFIIVAYVNAVNITDGLDGLSAGLLVICLVGFLAINSQQIDRSLGVFISVLLGAVMAFLYFNIYKARIIIGDVGALALGAALAVIGLLTGKTITLAVIGGVFIIEIASSLLQILSKKYLKRKLFPVAPFHLYLQQRGWEEPKIVMRAWLIGILFAVWVYTSHSSLKFFVSQAVIVFYTIEVAYETGRSHSSSTTLFLTVFGLFMIYDASSVIAFRDFGDKYHYIKDQCINAVLGLVALGFFSFFDYKKLYSFSLIILVAAIAMLIGVFLPGIGIYALGAHRWINLGVTVLQPAEFVKLSLAIYLAAWFSNKERGRLAAFGLLMGFVLLLIMAQPDMGTASIILFEAVVLYFLSGANIMQFIFIIPVLGVGGLILVLLAPYRLARLTSFLNMGNNVNDVSYHVKQILIALGSGGLFGVGAGNSLQKYAYLPENVTDSIFAIIAEEFGFLGSVALILLFLVVIWRGFIIASRAKDSFGRLLAVGIICFLGIQAVINLSAMTALIPLTGVPLPFISYGGSALIIDLGAVGILLNISRQGKNI